MKEQSKKQSAFWFSRHQPTTEQLAEIEARGYNLIVLEVGLQLGAVSLTTESDVVRIVDDLRRLVGIFEIKAIFGVFAAPMQEVLTKTRGKGVPCFAAWNITRPVEGGKPVFAHLRFCEVGKFELKSK